MGLFDWVKPLLDLPHRHRRVWRTTDRVHIELREVPEEDTPHFAERLVEELERHEAVEWAEVLARPGRVVVAYRPEGVSPEELVALVEGVEVDCGVSEHPFGVDRPDHPGDVEPIVRSVVALGADAGGLLLAVTGRFRGWRALPVEVDLAALLTVAQNVPALRNPINRRLTAPVAEIGLAVANGIAAGLAQGPLGPMLDIAHRANLLTEAEARRRTWHRLEPELCAKPGLHEVRSLRPPPRPVPLRHGPIEAYADKAWLASLGGFGVGLALTRSLDRAAAAVLAGIPKAAQLGRESFAAHLGRTLAARRILVQDPDVLRRLDRMDEVVIDARLLGSGTPGLGEVRVLGRLEAEEVRRRASALFEPDAPDAVVERDGWRLGPPERLGLDLPAVRARRRDDRPQLALVRRDRLEALLTIREAVDERAVELVAAARRAGLRVRLTDGGDLVGIEADEPPVAHEDLAGLVRALQVEGKGVVVVAGGDHPVLEFADCGIGLTLPGRPPPWGAALICGDDLAGPWLVFEAVREAKETSRQSANLAFFGASAAAFLAFGGFVPGTVQRVNTAVNGAAAIAIANGVRAGTTVAVRRMPARHDVVPWHRLAVEEVLARLGSGDSGLPHDEADRRRVHPPAPLPAPLALGRIVVDELLNPLTPVLAVGAGLSLAVGSVSDAVLVVGVVGLNALIGGVQRFRTEQAIALLGRRERQQVRVLRDGVATTVPADHLVPGDIVYLEAGEAVPADCRVIEADGLQTDESSLTGESLPVDKHAEPSTASIVAERSSMLYEGTSVAAGRAVAVVVAVGEETEAERGVLLAGEGPPPSGVETRLSAITTKVTPISVAAGLGILGSGLLRGRPITETAGAGVSLAVAAVPEGLPLLATVAQMSAARRLSGRGALVRNPRAIEALGRVDVVCVDKTGTLTEGHISLRVVATGSGDEAPEALSPRGRAVLAAALRATPEEREGAKLPHPTDRAVLRGGREAGVTAEDGMPGWRRGPELPFEPARAYHATVGLDDGAAVLSVKGAPEVVIPLCTHRRTARGVSALDARARRRLHDRVEDLAGGGLRVLAVAERPAGGDWPADRPVTDDDVEGLTFLGFVGLADPPRPTAAAAIDGARRAGVEVIMITGDHPSTAEGIATQLGLLDPHHHDGRPGPDAVMTGPEIDELDDDALAARLAGVTVCARVTPAHKVRIVRSLQRAGRSVAMTGDGANDAPAIRLADVGLALGTRATTAARDAADVVILDDRVETIVDAIAEGRTMWASVRDAVAVLVGGNLGEIAFTLGGSVLAGSSPLNARQLLLVNLLTDIAPAMAIAVRPPADRTVESLLREGPDRSLGEALNRAIAVRAVSTAAGAGAAWAVARVTGTPTRASTVALVALVGAQLGQTLSTGGRSPAVVLAGVGSAAVLAAIVQTPGVSRLFGCTPLGPVGWATGLTAAGLATAGSVVLPRHLDRLPRPWLERLGLAAPEEPGTAVPPLLALPAG